MGVGSIEAGAGLQQGRRANAGLVSLRGREKDSEADYNTQQATRLQLARPDRDWVGRRRPETRK